MRKERFYSYKTKLILSYLALICIPLMLLGGYAFITSKNALNEQTREEHVIRLADMGYQLERKLQEYVELTGVITYDDNILRILENDYKDIINLRRDLVTYMNPLFDRMIILKPELEDIYIYSSSDVPSFGRYLNPLSDMEEDIGWEEGIIEGWYTNNGNNRIYYIRKFYNYKDLKEDNYIVMVLNKEKLFSILEGTQDNHLLIKDSNDHVIYEGGDFLSYSNRITDRMNVFDTMRKDYMVIKQRLEIIDWELYKLVSIKVSADKLFDIIKITIIIILACLGLLILIAAYLSYTLFKPIRNLSKAMKRVSKGDFQVQLKSQTRDELGAMTDEFNHMTNKINTLIEQVYKANVIKKEAELKALQAQINPHFLYNTLSMINWKAVINNQKEISQCVNLLSRFYETALNKGKRIIPVYDEIENIKSYIDLQLIMHGDEFTIKYDIDDKVYEYYTLNLILQPFVENAIEHGLRKLDNMHSGELLFKACCYEDKLYFIIEDNGVGIDDEVFKHIYEQQSMHYGIKNVIERIQLQFGKSYGIHIENRIKEDGQGVRVTLTLPKYKIPE